MHHFLNESMLEYLRTVSWTVLVLGGSHFWVRVECHMAWRRLGTLPEKGVVVLVTVTEVMMFSVAVNTPWGARMTLNSAIFAQEVV